MRLRTLILWMPIVGALIYAGSCGPSKYLDPKCCVTCFAPCYNDPRDAGPQ